MDNDIIYYGGEVKSLGGGKVGGYLVLFGNENTTDLEGEFFTPKTDFAIDEDAKSAVYYQHGLDVKMGRRVLGKASLTVKDAGVWAEAQLSLRDEYEQAILDMVEAGKLGWSSGTAGHLVEREPVGKSWHISRWPLGLDASLTPTPAEPRTRAMPIKSLINPQQGEPAQGAGDAPPEADAGDNIKTELTEEVIMSDVKEVQAPDVGEMIEQKMAQLEASITAKMAGFVQPTAEPEAPTSKAEYEQAFKSYLHPRGKQLQTVKALEAGTNSEGGYTVPEDWMAELTVALTEGSLIRSAGARVMQITTDKVYLPTMTHSTAMVLTDEEASYDEADPSFGQIAFTPYKFSRTVKASEELVVDSMFDVYGQLILPDFLNARILAENAYFTTGTGSDQPQGIVTGAGTGVTATSATAITFDEVVELFHSLSYLYRQRGVWMMNDSTALALRQLKDGESRPLWLDSYSSTAPSTILGRPVITNNNMAEIATGNATILFCDPSYYRIAERAGLSIDVNPWLYMATGQVGYFARSRFDGKVMLAEAFKKLVQA